MRKKLNKDPPIISGVADQESAQLFKALNCLPIRVWNWNSI